MTLYFNYHPRFDLGDNQSVRSSGEMLGCSKCLLPSKITLLLYYSNFMSQISRRLLSLYMIDQRLIALIERGQQFSEGYYYFIVTLYSTVLHSCVFKKANCSSSGHAFAWSTICYSRKTVTDTSRHVTKTWAPARNLKDRSVFAGCVTCETQCWRTR